MSAVRKALDELEQEWQEIISIQKINYTLREQLPKLREYLLRDLITGKQDPAIGPLSKKLQMYEVPIARGTPYSMMLLRIDTTEGEYDQSDETLIEYALTNIAAELFGPRMVLWHCTDMHGFIVCLLSDKSLPNTIESTKISEEEELDVWIETQAFQLQRAAKPT